MRVPGHYNHGPFISRFVGGAVSASFKNLSIKVATNTTVTVAADYVTTTDGTNNQSTAVSSTINLGATGVDALDTGTIAIDTWYAIWVVAKPDGTTKCIASTSFTAPTMPATYTFKARIGAVQTIHGSATLYGTWQFGRIAQYVVGLAQTTIPPNICNFTTGTYSVTSPTLASKTVAGNGFFVPTTASKIHVLATNAWKAGTTANLIVAPSSAYSGTNNGPAGSNGIIPPIYIVSTANIATSAFFLLESTAIFVAIDAASGGAVSALGWEDNI